MKQRYLLLYVAWLTAVLALAGSLYFSDVLGYAPCDLCWWQRVFSYPLVSILFVGLWKKDAGVTYYALPFAILGGFVALYHNLIYNKIIPEVLSACSNGVSCTTKYVEFFGFVTIPLLSLLSFIFIAMLCIAFMRLSPKKSETQMH